MICILWKRKTKLSTEMAFVGVNWIVSCGETANLIWTFSTGHLDGKIYQVL